jgi:hypothetical protein
MCEFVKLARFPAALLRRTFRCAGYGFEKVLLLTCLDHLLIDGFILSIGHAHHRSTGSISSQWI